ncbi:MAG: hypothetical protein JSS29_05495 [Proteobacteria bacterium]|nr:hypothetical protein [Pseudomonadota bacterium]
MSTMQAIHDRARAHGPAPLEVILLPAAGTGPDDFVQAGFAAAARERGLAVDLTFAPLEFAHVTDRSAVERVLGEFVHPARARGSAVWLGGISLGGYVALCCAERDPGPLAGLCLFAPYLGSFLVTSEIARTGLAGWTCAPQAGEDDEERRIWRFLRDRRGSPPLHLGLGREDRFGERHRLLASALPAHELDTVPGGHDWPTWRRLWDNFLDARLAHLR